ncbi:class I SAM-dependent methyltransferase [Candidatus Latescibacterota bacterium]
MPVNEKESSREMLYQRDQYVKGGLGRTYWDYRDRTTLSLLGETDRKIADIGCGEGITLGKITAAFPANEVMGVDFMDENIDICRKYGLTVSQGSVYDMDMPDNSLDAALFMEVIEHLEEPEAALTELYRVIKPGGKIILVFPNDAMFKIARIMTLRFREASYDPGHLQQWTPGKASAILRNVGFSVFYVKSIPFYVWPLSLHCIMGARKPV